LQVAQLEISSIHGFLFYTERIREKTSCDSWHGERMSLRKLVFVLLLVLPLGLCKAQTAPAKPVEPTAIGVVYLLDSTSEELKPLPDEQWNQTYHGCGSGTECDSIEVLGDRSAFRLGLDEKFEFIFKTGSPEKVSLYQFDLIANRPYKKKRRFDFDRGQNVIHKSPIKGLPTEVSQFGASSYKLVPASPLAPGEYAINLAGEVYTFGVD
jgi:hypothetical protein